MGKKNRSIRLKISLLYIMLTVINIAIFSIFTYENQIDLITENTKFKAKEITSSLISALERFSREITTDGIFKAENRLEFLHALARVVEEEEGVIIADENGSVLYSSEGMGYSFTAMDEANSLKSASNKTYMGSPYYSTIEENADTGNEEMLFYVPFSNPAVGNVIIFFKRPLSFGTQLKELYLLISVIIIGIVIVHACFAFILFAMFVAPIQTIHHASIQIAEGDLDTRSPVKRNDEIGELSDAFNQMAESIQDQIKSLEHTANTDLLTGLYNRRELLERIQFEMLRCIRYADNQPQYFTLMFIDLDNFKIYNDTLGHKAGDWLLKRIAAMLKKSLRDVDIVGRYGGDEFLMILPSTRLSDAKVLAKRILKEMKSHKGFIGELGDFMEKEIRIPRGSLLGCSIGLEMFKSDDPWDLDTLIHRADEKLYQAKNAGKGCVIA